jgi:hypothetical protein
LVACRADLLPVDVTRLVAAHRQARQKEKKNARDPGKKPEFWYDDQGGKPQSDAAPHQARRPF